MTDLFGLEPQTLRTNDRKESAALVEVLKALRAHPAVAWCERMNSGAARVGGRFIRFGFTGCPDVLGMLRDGRLLGVEVKAPKGKRMGECEGAVLEFLVAQKVGIKKAAVVAHFGERYAKGPVYRAMQALVTAQAIHEAAGMVCIATAAK